jgi:hypothetical protein
MSTADNAPDESLAKGEGAVILPEGSNHDVEGHFSYAANQHIDENDARSEGSPFSPRLNDDK